MANMIPDLAHMTTQKVMDCFVAASITPYVPSGHSMASDSCRHAFRLSQLLKHVLTTRAIYIHRRQRQKRVFQIQHTQCVHRLMCMHGRIVANKCTTHMLVTHRTFANAQQELVLSHAFAWHGA